ncbi:uncharacterized protein LOC110985982 [Acanthaster planci]|uniref:Uncharacterized protein LOC110985982 n=1 Tax=Acanthaster planci TaxID=133434 RepID=A0A8B7ZIW3_ACAPL|nr:uncharacterized protein LOC110985982 [Acanthaster planci]XP_022103221.1 uncharacterized protein LOC110985982 [Acanthaster planci]XP_022103222.1 uncharacterized protein LOC110985982 [Acanthaster planci]
MASFSDNRSEAAQCSNSRDRRSSSSKPHISCHSPLKPSYLPPEDRIVRWASWETLNFRYKAPLKPSRKPGSASGSKKKQVKPKKEASKSGCQDSKKYHSKQKKDPDKTDHQEAMAESDTPCVAAAAEDSTSCADGPLTSDDLEHAGCHVSALPQCCLLRIFSYLPIGDLLRTGLVCQAWRQLSLDKSIWRSVALEDANILSWKRAAKAFQIHGTIALDFYNMENKGTANWDSMYCVFKKLPGLQYLRFGYVYTGLLTKIIQHLPDLKVLEVCWLTDENSEPLDGVTFDLGKLSKLIHLEELKIRSVSSLLQASMSFSGGLASIEKLKHLRKLSLTSLHESRIMPSEYQFLNKLPDLVELELGDCGNWRAETYSILGKLTNLRSLRLENGGCWCDEDFTPQCTCNISESLRKLTGLEKLELIMYTMPSDINPALQCLVKLQSLTFWPMVCLRGHVMGPCAAGCEAPLIQTNLDRCNALGNLRHLCQLTWGVPIITFDTPRQDYPYNVTTETAVKSAAVRSLTEILAKQLPETAVNILIVPVVMSKDHYEHSFFDLADDDDDSSGWSSDSEYWDTDDSDSDGDHGCAMDFGIPFGY